MTNGQIRDLCIALLHAETEDEVIGLLKRAGYWDQPALWRHYGDLENNWGQGGNQQSLAEAALVEKIVNSVDARLINECLERGIDPKSDDAPKTIREAVSRFFEGGTGKKMATGGLVEDWSDEKIREIAQGITLCGTGTRPVMNLTITDCGEVREDLFMPSRDRLTENDFKVEMIDVLEQALRNDETLRLLRNQRQKEMMTDKMKDDKPLADVLQNLIKSSPNLTALLQLGQRITAPFNANPTSSQEEKPFKGEIYPTFFKFKGTTYGETHKRDCPINYRMRLQFETDARDDYFARRIEGGKFSMVWVDKAGKEHKISIVGPNLRSGSATVMVSLPEGVDVSDVLNMTAITEDSRATFNNKIDVTVRPWAEHNKGGGTKQREKKPNEQQGNDRERPRQLSTPRIDPVYRDRWEAHKFDEFTAMKMDVEYDAENNEIPVFRINMDNTPLLNEIKQRRFDDEPARNQFMYGNVLVGLSLLLQDKDKGEQPADAVQTKVEDHIESTCRALAPFMLSLTMLAQEDLSDVEQVDGLEAATG
jgi:hypothetical protein